MIIKFLVSDQNGMRYYRGTIMEASVISQLINEQRIPHVDAAGKGYFPVFITINTRAKIVQKG